MPRGPDIWRMNVFLSEEMADSLSAIIESRGFSQTMRDVVGAFLKSYSSSKERALERIVSRSERFNLINRKIPSKRLTVEFPKKDMMKLNEIRDYLRSIGVETTRHQLILQILSEAKL